MDERVLRTETNAPSLLHFGSWQSVTQIIQKLRPALIDYQSNIESHRVRVFQVIQSVTGRVTNDWL